MTYFTNKKIKKIVKINSFFFKTEKSYPIADIAKYVVITTEYYSQYEFK